MDIEKIIEIPRAIIGRFGKEYSNLVLKFTQSRVQILNTKGINVVDPFLWKNVTAAHLSYHPLQLHQLVLEVNTRRIRNTNNLLIEEPFISLFFETEHIPLIEKTVIEYGLLNSSSSSSQTAGIPELLVTQPFSYFYHPFIRQSLSHLTKLTRLFVTLCFIYTLFKYMTTCTNNAVQCQTILGNTLCYLKILLESILLSFGGLFQGSLWETVIGIVVIWISLPFAFIFVTGGVILYMADFVVHSTIFLMVFNTVAVVVQDYKTVKSVVMIVLRIIKKLWKIGRKIWRRLFYQKEKVE